MPEAGRPRVLVIEDDDGVVALLHDLLTFEGYEVVTAADGLSGLVTLQGADADVVLLDIMMPDVDGLRLLQQLHEEGDGALPLPIVVITGSPEGARRARDLLGADDVFDKPFDPMRLLARLRTHAPPLPDAR